MTIKKAGEFAYGTPSAASGMLSKAVLGPMKTPSTLTVTRTAGLAVWATIAIPGILSLAVPPPDAPTHASWTLRALGYVPYVAFGPAFYWNARRIQGPSPALVSVVVLALQAAMALLTVSDMVILVALEIPFILVGRAATVSTAALVVASAARAVTAEGHGFLGPLPWLSHLPYAFVVGLTVLTNAVWQGLAFAGGYLVATQHRSAEELARSHRELARVNAELLATQQLLTDSSRLAERLHISRELHDAAGHHLAALSLNLELAARRADGTAAEPIREAHAVARLLLADIREMVSNLRQHRPLDLRRALLTLVAGTHEPRIHLALAQDVELTDPAQAHAVFRCVQEAITNAVRHAGARNVWIGVALEGERLELRIRDDGGGASELVPGNGLGGMRERFEDAGGGLEIAADPGQGVRLRGWFPIRGERS
jgi:signal transduction histidine kinase